MKPERDDVIDFISDQIISACAEIGIEGEKAEKIAQKVSVITRKAHHGTQYIAKVDRMDRNTRIKREFNGANKDEICKKYGLSERQFYRLLKEKNDRRNA